MTSPFNPDFQNKSIDAKIIAAFEKISEVFRVLLWEKSKKVNLSPIQIQILVFLKYHQLKYCTVNSLAEEFNMTPATISDAVKIMVNKNIIKKIKNSEDKRFQFLKITAKGEKIINNVYSFVEPLLLSVLKIDPEAKEILLSSLLKIISELNSQEILIIKRMCFTCNYFQTNNGEFYCKLLEMKLHQRDLRIDCPEHQPKMKYTKRLKIN